MLLFLILHDPWTSVDLHLYLIRKPALKHALLLCPPFPPAVEVHGVVRAFTPLDVACVLVERHIASHCNRDVSVFFFIDTFLYAGSFLP